MSSLCGPPDVHIILGTPPGQSPSDQWPPSICAGPLQQHSTLYVRSGRHGRFGNSGLCISFTPISTPHHRHWNHLPFIQPYRILDEEQGLVRQQQRSEGSSQVQRLEEHGDSNQPASSGSMKQVSMCCPADCDNDKADPEEQNTDRSKRVSFTVLCGVSISSQTLSISSCKYPVDFSFLFQHLHLSSAA